MSVSTRPRAEKEDSRQPVAVQPSQVACHVARDLVRIERPRELGELWIGPCGDRTLGSGLLDESLVNEPLNRPSLNAGVVKAKPRLAQLREVEQRVLEAPKSAAPCDRSLEQSASLRIPDALDEVLHVLVSLLRRDRL